MARTRGRRAWLLEPPPGASAPGAAALEAFWHAIATIPRGRVCSYGGIARAAGYPGQARRTAYALRVAPAALHLPWHRVLGAGGRIAFPKGSSGFREQARRLRAEGVPVRGGRVPRERLADPPA